MVRYLSIVGLMVSSLVTGSAFAAEGKSANTEKETKAETEKAGKESKPEAAKPAASKAATGKTSKPKTSSGTIVTLKTSEGIIKLELADKEAPVTVKNFLSYVNDKFYDGTVFHRVIEGFMIQGGGYTIEGDKLVAKATKAPITNEAKNGLKNDRGTIAMARTADPNSATAQFFINHVNNDRLNYPQPDGHGYAVFGKVIEGMDVVDKIAKVKTGTRPGMADVPVTDIKILSAEVAKPAVN